MNDTMKLLQRKVAGIPAWVLGLVAVGLVAFYLYRKRKANTAAAAAAGSTSGVGTASSAVPPNASDNGLTGPDIQYLGGWPGQPIVTTPTPVTTPPPVGLPGSPGGTTPAPVTPVSTPQPAQTQQGAGWWLGPVSTAIKGSDGYWYQWESPAVAASFPNATRYVQVDPNYFVQVTAASHLAAGTPQFLRTAAPVVTAPPVSMAPQSSTAAAGALQAAA